MAKIKYDVSDVEDTAFEKPKPGVYRARVDSIEEGESKAGNQQLTVVLKITKGEYKNALMWFYAPLDPDSGGAFRMKELIKALGKRAKGTIDTDEAVGTELDMQVKTGTYEGEYSPRVGSLHAVSDNGSEPDEDLKADADPDPDDDPDPDEEEDNYDDWSVADLKAELDTRELPKGGPKSRLVGRLRKDDEEGNEPF